MAVETYVNNPSASLGDGTAATVGNTGGVNGDAFFLIDPVAPSTFEFSTDSGKGANSGASYWINASTAKSRGAFDFTATDDLSFRFYVYVDSKPNTTPTAAAVPFASVQGTTFGIVGNLVLSSSGVFQMTDQAGTVLKSFSTGGQTLDVDTLYRIEGRWHKGAAGSGKFRVDFFLGNSTTPVDSYENTTTANMGTLQAKRFQVGSSSSTPRLDVYVSGIKIMTDTYAGIGPLATNVAPVATIMAEPASRAPGTVTVTGAVTDSDGTVASVTVEVLQIGDGTIPGGLVVNPPNNPTVTPVVTGLNTASASVSATFTGIPGRYHVRIRGTDNAGAASNLDAVVEINVFGASGEYTVKPFQVLSLGTFTVVGASTAILTQTDGDLGSYLNSVDGPTNQDVTFEMCSFGPDSIDIQVTADADASPSTEITATLFLADGTTTVYADTWTVSTSGASGDWVHTVSVDSGGLAIATPGEARKRMRLRLRANQP